MHLHLHMTVGPMHPLVPATYRPQERPPLTDSNTTGSPLDRIAQLEGLALRVIPLTTELTDQYMHSSSRRLQHVCRQ